MKSIKILFKSFCLILFFLSSHAFSNTLTKVEIIGNDRISDETIKLFISVNINDEINDIKINKILKDLYQTNFFKNISVKFDNHILEINVEENPIIENIFYNGIKSDRIIEILKQGRLIKQRSSYNKNLIKKDKLKIEQNLKNLGYYNSTVDVLIEETKNNLINITYNVALGKKSKIKKITFIGNKVFKDKKLRRIVTSTEYKFWKFISGRKFLNQNSVFLMRDF
jgi:outer membrane protein insertion porin family